MLIEWDPAKAEENWRRHRVRLTVGAEVLRDPFALSQEDVSAEGEQRFVAIGMDAIGRILTVAYTYRVDRTRLISARHATRRERDHYEQR